MRTPLYNRSFSMFILTGALALVGSFCSLNAEENWQSFRGPHGTGHSVDKDVPSKWNEKSVVWKTSLKGEGQSSPVSWGDKLFVTSASEDGSERYVICLSKEEGKVIWEKTLSCKNPEKAHKMNTWATPSCVTDGERVVAFFGLAGIHCFDMEGKKLWSQHLGDFPGMWGVAASPVMVDDLVIQNTDCSGASSLVAFDKKTGEEVWKTTRQEKPRGGWSTPIVVKTEEGEILVLNGEFGVRAYDPQNGKELWFCKAFNGRGAPVPDYAKGVVYVVNGKPGDTYAVELGGSGDVTDSKMKWHAKRQGGRDLPSPAVIGDYLLVASMSGVVTCYDTKSGDTLWSEKINLKGLQLAASPLVAKGLLYLQNVNGGDTIVIKPGKGLKVLAINSLGADKSEIFRATLAPIGGRLYARSHTTLYCIGK